VLGDVVQADRLRLLDQQPEDPAAARQVPDGLVGRRCDAAREELRELVPALVQDADRGEPGAGELACSGQDEVQQPVQVQLGGQRSPDLQKPLEPRFAPPFDVG
jgi:hypothetical protein